MSDEKKKPTVLLGSAGTGIAFAAASAIRREWRNSVRIISMDTNPDFLVTTSLLSDNFIQVPAFNSPLFRHRLIDLVRLENVGYYLPLMPQELVIASNLYEDGQLGEKINVLAPSYRMSKICADKLSLMKFLSGKGIPVPITALASEPFPADGYFIKPRNGCGSSNARYINANNLNNIKKDECDSYILQSMCDQPEITTDVFYCNNGSFCKVICRERLEIKAGVSTKCRVFFDKKIEKLAIDVASLIGMSGAFCFQLMQSKGEWVVTDVNPRPGAGTAMCIATGNDFFASTFALAFNENYKKYFSELTQDFVVTRQYSEFVMSRYNVYSS